MLLMLLQGDQQLDCALDLMRRLPPQQIEKNLGDLIDLVPSLCEDLLSSVDQPLKIAKDKQTGKDYLLCDYNRDGDSYRLVRWWRLCANHCSLLTMCWIWRQI